MSASVQENSGQSTPKAGAWTALTAALLGWMFDGFEMGLFPLVARPALRDLLTTPDGQPPSEPDVALWFGVATAGFLIGAAAGGVLFGWLGDRIGRVRAMTLSVFTYAVFSGICGFAQNPLQIAGCRFIAALGMGGEWSLGVALVMEIWPNQSRGMLAAVIGAAANVGYLFVSLLSLGLGRVNEQIKTALLGMSLTQDQVHWLTANSSWRILLMVGATPAVLTFFIRLFVPESRRWEEQKASGKTSGWSPIDLLGVLVGVTAAGGMVALAANKADWAFAGLSNIQVRVALTLASLLVCTVGFLFPVFQYLARTKQANQKLSLSTGSILWRMLLGASLSGVPLLFTWAATQWLPNFADKLTDGKVPEAKAYAQFWSSAGAILGTMVGALVGSAIGRRITYVLLCISSMAAAYYAFQPSAVWGSSFLFAIFLVGATSASFYGWLPLYLPELFPTAVRATGQGFSFNFGRILAAVGVMQIANLLKFYNDSYAKAGQVVCLIYLVGMVIIWLAPETKGKELLD